PLKNVRLKQNVLIAGILRGGEVIIPGGNTTFRSGDTVVIVVSGDTVLLRFNDIFE
ncbi:MAG: Trk system potassium transporter TrkA, partial [Clostridia bacterium]|nr:Trk system potassium transporter TrkA [Clostridia bacterium]